MVTHPQSNTPQHHQIRLNDDDGDIQCRSEPRVLPTGSEPRKSSDHPRLQRAASKSEDPRSLILKRVCRNQPYMAQCRTGLDYVKPPLVFNSYDETHLVSEGTRRLMSLFITLLTSEEHTEPIIGLSGGTTPRRIYEAIGNSIGLDKKNSNASGCDWSRLKFYVIDERYVAADSPLSNTKMIRDTLMKLGDLNEDQLVYPDTSLPLEECVSDYDKKISLGLKFARSACVILGMGPDGHLASWFPPMDANSFQVAYDPTSYVCHTHQNRFPAPDRITVAMHVITNAEKKVLFLLGEEKVSKWKELMGPKMTEGNLIREPLLQVAKGGGVSILSYPALEIDEICEMHAKWRQEKEHISIVILGASGDLAKKKTLSALFSLFCEGLLPSSFHIAGYARTKMSDDDFWDIIYPHISSLNDFFTTRMCQYVETDDEKGSSSDLENKCDFVSKFKARISYHSGQYDDENDFGSLDNFLRDRIEDNFKNCNRLFYLAVPPDVFAKALKTVKRACWPSKGWGRCIVEKPFGRDLETSNELAETLSKVITEAETFRIDHYLGKEMVLNIMTMRFANPFFSPIWSRQYIQCVRITFKEMVGVEGRGGYFDQYGVIRDIIQNHLLQVLTLIAMERPVTLKDDDIRDEKVKVLRSVSAIPMERVVIGQYTAGEDMQGYRDDPTVKKDSRTPTFAVCVLFIDNERWAGVPFILKAGKALEQRITEVRMQFQAVPGGLFGPDLPRNELVIRVQPNDAIYLKCMAKTPGLGTGLQETELDLTVQDRFDIARITDAYERLILDVIRGDKQNFVRADELREAWRIFTPMLHEMEDSDNTELLEYKAGSAGPTKAYEMITKYGFKRFEGYRWRKDTRSA